MDRGWGGLGLLGGGLIRERLLDGFFRLFGWQRRKVVVRGVFHLFGGRDIFEVLHVSAAYLEVYTRFNILISKHFEIMSILFVRLPWRIQW